ncbi:hypothetical protein MMC28_006148 [Mycoblastus sanguinarius]|nr:hypothetical protein [Mycoblastus sanguinarius]
MNPFAKRSSHNKRSLLVYKTLTILTWLLVLAVGIFFTFKAPINGKTIWDQNKAHPTAFALDPMTTSIYWVGLLLLQVGYIYFLYANDAEVVRDAANVGSHFIVHNLLQSAFILVWVHSRFWVGEILLIVDIINLTSLYFRHPRTPRFIHMPVVSGPMAWTFMAILSNGAAMVGAQTVPARIFANVAVWAILFYGLFFLVIFIDYSIGFMLSVLVASLGVHQLALKSHVLQPIFAFVTMSLLVLATLAMIIPPIFGKELTWTRVDEDHIEEHREREPLLDDDDDYNPRYDGAQNEYT